MALIQQLINGLALGSVYALIAIGYTMVYGIIKLINFAHGDIYMIGAFLGYFAVSAFHFSFVPALLMAMVGCAILGMTIEKIAYKPLRSSPRIVLLITAIAMSLILEHGMATVVVGPNPRPFPPLFKVHQYFIGPIQINNVQLINLAVAGILVLILQLIIYRTKTGKAMRATSFDMEAAQLMGININNIVSVTFAIGSSLAGAAGVLVGMMYPRIDPYMGMMPGLKAFISAVLGGIGVLPGAMVGGLIVGISETLTKAFISTRLSDAVAFTILIIILIFKPAGLLGKPTREKV